VTRARRFRRKRGSMVKARARARGDMKCCLLICREGAIEDVVRCGW